MCGKREEMNHSLFYLSGIRKIKWPVKFLNLLSNSQIGSATLFLIYFIYVIYCDSNLGFLNSAIKAVLMSFNI
jgi:hypothetical protein